MKTLQSPYFITHQQTHTIKDSLVRRFFSWCNAQENNRLLWVGVILTLHGCIITPLTLMMIMLSGNNMMLWPPVIAAITMCLVTNLAALPAKITIPVFFLSLLIDLAVIASCIVSMISIA